jgi:hypothetical protein
VCLLLQQNVLVLPLLHHHFVVWSSWLSAYFFQLYSLCCHNIADLLFLWFFDCAHLFLLSLMQ